MKYIIGVIIILAILSQQKSTPDISELTPKDSILAFGDSLTYGYGTSQTQSYPSVLSTLTQRKVINAGVNGETSDEGLKRLASHLEDGDIKLMLLCLGGNDIIQRKSMDTLKSNLKTMIRMAKEKDIDILLISVPNFTLSGLSPLALYEEVAAEENVPLASGILSQVLSNPSYKSDQIHPNALGYNMMAEKIYEKFKEVGWQ
jgi:lysophospholipase L1-like esterase